MRRPAMVGDLLRHTGDGICIKESAAPPVDVRVQYVAPVPGPGVIRSAGYVRHAVVQQSTVTTTSTSTYTNPMFVSVPKDRPLLVVEIDNDRLRFLCDDEFYRIVYDAEYIERNFDVLSGMDEAAEGMEDL